MARQQQKGFTLMELMVTLSVLLILMTVGMPSLSNYLHSQRLNTATQLLKDSYNQARFEAVTRKKAVTLCPLDASTGGCGNSWGAGILVYIDENGDGAFVAADDLRLRQADFPDGVAVAIPSRTQVRISAAGTTTDTGTFTISVSGSTNQKSLVISSAGRIRLG
ncbi:prepilin-type N-terminal cleavage/methylation domain-containing protein [Amphritea opalescens]|uniref:Type II secretion system protein H n=1 Tax=Amphritea opalescens TaxID=2490544 RepID=A0A430KLQ8_9GAMM|nr:GspH/FimT family pseudopilin [Amphritea opalescens]RTE64374.1 prepilin-type N-terminal cleavage/methylation domain-containing protein [Amphritea opalescens]